MHICYNFHVELHTQNLDKNQEGVYNVNKYDKLTGEKLGNIDLGKYFIQMGRLMYTDAEAKQVTCHLINRDMFGIACLCV